MTALALLFACSPDNEITRLEVTDVFLQADRNEVDILFVVDNSLSMGEEQAALSENFDLFIQDIEETNVDFHVGVITTDMDDPSHRGQLQGEPAYLTMDTPDYKAAFRDRVFVGLDGSDKEQGIEAALNALREPLLSGANAGFRRPDATLSVVVVTDENDCTHRGALNGVEGEAACYDNNDRLVDIATLIAETRELALGDERVLLSTVVGPEASAGCADIAKPGLRYHSWAEPFGGLDFSICEPDFAPIMTELGLQASGMLDTFNLSENADASTIEVTVDNEIIPEDSDNGWTYDDEFLLLTFHGDGVPSRGASIQVTYYVGY